MASPWLSQAGETLGLVGESGCGKSTLGRLLIRLIPATAGQRSCSTAPTSSTLDARALREVRRVDADHLPGPVRRAQSAHDGGGHHHGAAADPRRTRRRRRTRQGGRDAGRWSDCPRARAERFPHEFSGGQRQRIGIARALVLHPRFVVCDEPVSALDVSVQAQIVNLLADLQQELGLTYLFIAHDLAVVKHISTRVAVMYLGKIVELADKRALYAAPRHPYTQALIAAVPVTHPTQRAAARKRRQRLEGDIPSALHPPPGCRFHTRCPHVMPICREAEPRISEPAPGHQVACHLIG